MCVVFPTLCGWFLAYREHYVGGFCFWLTGNIMWVVFVFWLTGNIMWVVFVFWLTGNIMWVVFVFGFQYFQYFDCFWLTGNISRGDVLTTMPFGNNVDLINLQGRYLRQALEHAVSKYDKLNRAGAFLQVSGQ